MTSKPERQRAALSEDVQGYLEMCAKWIGDPDAPSTTRISTEKLRGILAYIEHLEKQSATYRAQLEARDQLVTNLEASIQTAAEARSCSATQILNWIEDYDPGLVDHAVKSIENKKRALKDLARLGQEIEGS